MPFAAEDAVVPQRSRFDVGGLAIFAGLVVLGLAAWWLAPWLIGVIKHQDCVGSGRMDC